MGPMRLDTLSLVAAIALRILSTTAEACRRQPSVLGPHLGTATSGHSDCSGLCRASKCRYASCVVVTCQDAIMKGWPLTFRASSLDG